MQIDVSSNSENICYQVEKTNYHKKIQVIVLTYTACFRSLIHGYFEKQGADFLVVSYESKHQPPTVQQKTTIPLLFFTEISKMNKLKCSTLYCC